MGVPRIDLAPMTVEEFFDFTDARPDDEKWELIEGEPILNATPSFMHQRIAGNIHSHLLALTTTTKRSWTVIPGIGVRVAGKKLPVPDVLIRPDTLPYGDPMSRECDDMIVAFEVLPQSTSDRDLRWKRAAYTSLPSLTHYVVVAQDTIDAVIFARDDGFEERRLKSLDATLEFALIGISLPLSAVYSNAGLR
jgi:Uma2 family endonuclease